MGSGAAGRVKYVGYWNVNNETFSGKDIVEDYKKKYNDDFYTMSAYSMVTMLSKAIKDARSADPVRVAFALEGMKAKSLNGDVEMRKTDHQMQQPLYIATWTASSENGRPGVTKNTRLPARSSHSSS